MSRFHFFLAIGLLSALVNCATSRPGAPRPPKPDRSVSLPYEIGVRERQYLPDIADMLEEYNFHPVQYGGAPYKLDFTIDDGPINADTTITLYKHGQVLVRAQGRDGGPKMVFDRPGVIRRSFQRCLADFEDQLDRAARWDEDAVDYAATAAPMR